jgi:GntR family transcriptional regulator of arabinose operon
MNKRMMHEEVKSIIQAWIEEGKLKPGDRVPSEHKLVEQLSVGRSRVRLALRDLEVEGYLIRRQGSGSYVAPTSQRARPARLLGDNTVAMMFRRYASRYARSLVEGFMHHMAVAGMQIAAYNVQPDAEDEPDSLRAVAESGVAGMVVWVEHDTPRIRETLQALRQRRFPVALVDRRLEGLEIDSVASDNEAAGYKLTTALIAHGHRYIAFGGYKEGVSSIVDRFEGYRRALEEAGLAGFHPHEPELGGPLCVLDTDLNGDTHEAVKTVMAFRDRPTAFVCIHDLAAARVAMALGQLGYSIPSEIELAAVDDGHEFTYSRPPGHTVEQNGYSVGAQSAEVLLARMSDADTPVQRRVVELEMRLESIEASAAAG